MATKSNADVESTPDTGSLHDLQIVYADRVIEVGVGPSVSRLTLGLESGPNKFTPVARLIMPTSALFEAVEVISQTMIAKEDVRKNLIKGLDDFKNKLMLYETNK